MNPYATYMFWRLVITGMLFILDRMTHLNGTADVKSEQDWRNVALDFLSKVRRASEGKDVTW